VSKHDAVFEPLLGKRRSVRRALLEVAERWARSPIEDGGVRAALEESVRHLIHRGAIRGELPAGVDAAALAREFVAGLAAGRGPRRWGGCFQAPGDQTSPRACHFFQICRSF
jgi:hypothetical protein